MDLGNFRLFTALSRRMDWLGDRQRVLAQNVANANTPDFRAKDLKPLDFDSQMRRAAGRVQMATTDEAHRPGRPMRSAHGERPVQDENATTLSGNAVEIEAEMQKVAETGMDYQMMTNLYRKHMDLLRTAIGRPGG